jgi:hypothetical protein
MRGDEARVVAAFCEHLRAQGWAVTTEVAWCDVRAERDGAVICAEAKGRTTAPGLASGNYSGGCPTRTNRPPATP